MTSSITSATHTSASASSALSGQPTMDRNAFLSLLVAQLSHQDPLQPQEGTEFVQQLSQFSLVEQAIQQSNQLEVLSTQVRGLSSNEAVGLVGNVATVRGHGVAWDGISATTTNVSLGAAAQKVTATITDSNGRAVRTIELGAHSAGAVRVSWDGRDDHGQPVARGNYSINVSATTAEGSSVDVAQDVTGTVVRVSFDKGYPELTLDNGSSAPISDLVSVARAGARTP